MNELPVLAIPQVVVDHHDFLLLVVSDLHGGHLLGMLAPDTKVFDEDWAGNRYERPLGQNALQVFLYDSYRSDIDKLVALAAGRPIIVKVNGDITQGTRYPREWVSTRQSDQILIAVRFLEELCEIPNVAQFDFLIGTGGHELEEGTSPILVAEMLSRKYGDRIRFNIANHYLSTINNVSFDMAHHGPGPGARRWLEGNNLRWYCNDIQQRELDLDRRPPDWVVRSHYHTVARSASDYRKGTNLYRTEAILTPGYTGMDAYGRQATRSKYEVHVGALIWEIFANGTTKLHPSYRILDVRRKEIIQ